MDKSFNMCNYHVLFKADPRLDNLMPKAFLRKTRYLLSVFKLFLNHTITALFQHFSGKREINRDTGRSNKAETANWMIVELVSSSSSDGVFCRGRC